MMIRRCGVAICWLAAVAGVGHAELFVPDDVAPGDFYHLIFLTDDAQSGFLDDLTFRDNFVMEQAAADPDLEGIQFHALVTVASIDAKDRVDIEGPIYRLDGALVADSERDLWDRRIENPVNVTPSGARNVDTLVWTGASSDGGRTNCSLGGNFPCQLGNPGGASEQYAGTSSATDRDWFSGSQERWNQSFPLYGLSVAIQVPIVMVPGDFDGNGVLEAADIDLLGEAIRTMSTDPQFDLDASGAVNIADLGTMVTGLMNTYYGDSNLDLEFNSGDLVTIFALGQYEDALEKNSTWASGDWNQDQEFNSSDLVFAFAGGGFEQGPRAAVAAVPEPSSLSLLLISLISLKGFRQRRHS